MYLRYTAGILPACWRSRSKVTEACHSAPAEDPAGDGWLHGHTPPYSDTSQRASEGQLSLDCQEEDSGLDAGTEHFPSLSEALMNRSLALSDPGLDSPQTSPVIMARLAQHHQRQGSDAPGTAPVSRAQTRARSL